MRITIYQLYDNGSFVSLNFDAIRDGEMFLSEIMNFNVSELGKIIHWSSHSEVKVPAEAVLNTTYEQKDWICGSFMRSGIGSCGLDLFALRIETKVLCTGSLCSCV